MAFRPISSIRSGDRADPIEVRLIRKWHPFWLKSECSFLLLDREGAAVEARGNIRDEPYFDSFLDLQRCYRITDYLSVKARKTYNVVPHPATVKIATGTTFIPIDDFDFPHYYFNFQPFERLPDLLNQSLLLSDYIGRFHSIVSDTATSTGRRLLKLLLEDLNDNFIEIALWEEIANIIDLERLKHEPFPCIIAITSSKVKKYNYLQLESTSATHMYINPEIEDKHDLTERFMEKYKNIPIEEHDRFTVAQLLEKKAQQNSERIFTCVASIVSFVEGKPWFYKGCVRCNRKLTERGDMLACGYHPREQQPNFNSTQFVVTKVLDLTTLPLDPANKDHHQAHYQITIEGTSETVTEAEPPITAEAFEPQKAPGPSKDVTSRLQKHKKLLLLKHSIYVSVVKLWGYDKFPKESPLAFYEGGKPIVPAPDMLDGLQIVLKNMAAYIQKEFPKTLKFWRLQSPRHFHGGDWNQNGSCLFNKPLKDSELDLWFDPSNNGVNKEARVINQLIVKALQDTDIELLDLTHLSEFRADAHPATWLGKKDVVAVWGEDCMHWCLPGVPDTWVNILWQLVRYRLGTAGS
ncbi:hypothetical protein L1987_11527 [Smallanthus sonchifolius]|uniref:Uncharacterized protein n=1 Tax=Smallanthus sonchifolius TaxID=185202 RepID=A0ACB9JC25_9ASTR|nr:hypothetical protein L1987_11527 [Smallanthus sonchifolius]